MSFVRLCDFFFFSFLSFLGLFLLLKSFIQPRELKLRIGMENLNLWLLQRGYWSIPKIAKQYVEFSLTSWQVDILSSQNMIKMEECSRESFFISGNWSTKLRLLYQTHPSSTLTLHVLPVSPCFPSASPKLLSELSMHALLILYMTSFQASSERVFFNYESQSIGYLNIRCSHTNFFSVRKSRFGKNKKKRFLVFFTTF